MNIDDIDYEEFQKLSIEEQTEILSKVTMTPQQENTFGGVDNFNSMLMDYTKRLAQFQADHKLDFDSVMSIAKVFERVVELADPIYLSEYVKILFENGVNYKGEDLDESNLT